MDDDMYDEEDYDLVSEATVLYHLAVKARKINFQFLRLFQRNNDVGGRLFILLLGVSQPPIHTRSRKRLYIYIYIYM